MKKAWCFAVLLAFATPNPSAAQDERVSELERKVDVLTQEIERLRLGAAADTSRYERRQGLAPAASKVYGVSRGVSIGGYGEMLYENFDRERENGTSSGLLDRLDYLRQILYVGYKFDDQLLFNSEIELEHAGVHDEAAVEGEADLGTGEVEGSAELSGEVSLEFAYIEWAPGPRFGVRAGMLLVPVGLLNELHEPPIFIGARRPEVEQRIIPTTWRGNGFGVFGELPGRLAYRAYLTEGLDATHFSSNGIRDGRQSGSRSLLTMPALSARLDYVGSPGVLVGGSIFTGDAWQNFQPAVQLSPRVTVTDVHGRIEWNGLEARGLYAVGTLDDADLLSDELGLTAAARLGESFWGGYFEAAFDLLPRLVQGTRYSLAPYARWETYDTQDDVPGGVEDPARERTVVTAGVAFRPHPNVVLKADQQWRSNEAETEANQWNLAVGYLF